MKVNILSQGVTTEIDNSVGVAISKYLSSKNYNKLTVISAFASKAGVNGLSSQLNESKDAFESITIIVGVDQKGTSKEALQGLVELDVNTFVFYHPGRTIFHPKIYLFEGGNQAQIIIGSSNLTSQGFYTNTEASIHLDLDMSILSDQLVIKDLKNKFKSLFDFTDPNLRRLDIDLINELVDANIVLTEGEMVAVYNGLNGNTESLVVRDIIKNKFPTRQLPSVPPEFKSIHQKRLHVEIERKNIGTPSYEQFELVWRRRSLPASSVETPGSANTNPTGGIRLVQDKFMIEGAIIDQTTYFRKTVFGSLNWNIEKNHPLVEKASGKFKINVLGKEWREVLLDIRHKPTGEAGQGNYTTSISWGELSANVRELNLVGCILNLYKSVDNDQLFKLEIK